MKPVLISGAGIAGKALSWMLRDKKIPYKLIEKFPAANVAGAGICLPANAIRMAEHIGISESIISQAHRVKSITYADPQQILSTASLEDAPLNRNNFVALKRSTLDKILSDGLDSSVHYSTEIMSLKEERDGINVTLASNGQIVEEQFSALVAADGIHSSTRRAVFSSQPLSEFGLTIFRWICPWDVSKNRTEPFYMFEHGRAFMVYPISNDRLYCYAHLSGLSEQELTQEQVKKIISQNFSACKHDVVNSVLQLVPQYASIILGRMQAVDTPMFSKGRVALIGDASHACTPMLQQGAALAFEDCIVLSELLDNFSPQIAFNLYEQFRKEEILNIVHSSNMPVREMTKEGYDIETFYSNVRENGPLNVQGWKKIILRSDSFFKRIEEFIKSNKDRMFGQSTNFYNVHQELHEGIGKTYNFESETSNFRINP